MADMGRHPGAHHPTGHRQRPWPLFLIASPAAVAVWSGWVALGAMCGFGPVNLLPGIGHGLTLNTAITLPVGVEAYGAYALGAWLIPGTPERARKFAMRSAIGSLALGMSGQVVYHLLAAAHRTRAPWPVTVLVACMPVITLGFGAALTHLLRVPAADPAAEPVTQPWPRPAPVLMVAALESAPEAAGEPAAGAAADAILVPPGEPRPVPPAATAPAAGRAAKEPARKPAKEPRPRAARIPEDPDARRARAEYRKSVSQGRPLSDRALAARFGRSRTWAASRIAEVKDGPALTAQAPGSP